VIFFGNEQQNIWHRLLRRTLVHSELLSAMRLNKLPEFETEDATSTTDKVIATQQAMP
jgi:hypothetical protein